MKNLYITLICFLSLQISGQEKVWQTFKDTRVINTHSVETLRKGKLDFRVSHRFGDFAGDAGGWQTLYGLENAADVLIGFEYGLTDNFMVGLSRSKGNGPLRQNVNSFAKIRIMQQQINGNAPFSLTLLGMTSISTMQRSTNPSALNFFDEFLHRMTYNMQIIVGRKFSDRFSLQGTAAWTYRNIVASTDINDLVSLGFAAKYQFSKVFALIVDGIFPLSSTRSSEFGFFPPIGLGFEWETGGGHVFQINLTNARGLVETDFIPYTRSDWGEGQYRIGFTISRLFTL